MKIVIKEISLNGEELLVYLMTETNQPISCEITSKEKLDLVIKRLTEKITNEIPKEWVSYLKFIKQDGVTK